MTLKNNKAPLPQDWLISVFHQQENFTPLKYSTKIILILTADEWITSQILTLSYLTTKNIFNVVTINLRQRNSSFLAYHPHSTNRMLSEIYSPLNLSQLFEDKAKNLNKSPLKVVQYSDLPFTGVGDGVVYGEAAFILMILERKLNATLTLTTHINAARVNDVHEMYSNGTDICLFSVQLTNDPYVIHGGQWTYPFTPVNTNILVLRKKATLCSFFVSLCDKASGVFLLAVLLIYLIYRASKRSNDPTATPLDIFGLVLLASLHFYPQRSLPSVILMNLSVLALIYVTIIQSSLTSFLISPESQQIETIRQFAEEGYKIYMQDHTNMFAMDEYPELFVNYTGPPMVGDTLLSNYFTMFPKMGTLCIERSFELFVKYSIPNYFHLIPEPVRRGWFVYKLPLNSPFYDCVNDVTFRIFEGGLSQYMRLSGYVASRISIPTIMPEMIEETVLLFHLDLAMFIVSFGLFASSLVFLVELQWAKR